MQHTISVSKKKHIYIYVKHSCFGNLFIFCGLPAREPSTIICYGKQDDLTQQKIPWRETFGKNEGEWTEKVEFTKEEIPGSRGSMQGYLLAYHML